jgi:Phosphopantetheine attachment site
LVTDTWADVLRHHNFGRHDDFFTIGGNSLLASLVMYRLRGALGLDLDFTFIFDHSTVAELTAAIEACRA